MLVARPERDHLGNLGFSFGDSGGGSGDSIWSSIADMIAAGGSAAAGIISASNKNPSAVPVPVFTVGAPQQAPISATAQVGGTVSATPLLIGAALAGLLIVVIAMKK